MIGKIAVYIVVLVIIMLALFYLLQYGEGTYTCETLYVFIMLFISITYPGMVCWILWKVGCI